MTIHQRQVVEIVLPSHGNKSSTPKLGCVTKQRDELASLVVQFHHSVTMGLEREFREKMVELAKEIINER